MTETQHEPRVLIHIELAVELTPQQVWPEGVSPLAITRDAVEAVICETVNSYPRRDILTGVGIIKLIEEWELFDHLVLDVQVIAAPEAAPDRGGR